MTNSSTKGMLGTGFIEALNQCPKLSDSPNPDASITRVAYATLLTQIPPDGEELEEIAPDLAERGIRVQNGIVHLPPGVDVQR